MGFSAFGDIQIGHNFEAGDNGPAVALGNLHVLGAGPVHPESDDSLPFVAVGFDVDIGHAHTIGVGNDLVGQPDDRAVVLVNYAGRP